MEETKKVINTDDPMYCSEHASNPPNKEGKLPIGFDTEDAACKDCLKVYPEYAEKCKKLMLERGGAGELKITEPFEAEIRLGEEIQRRR